MTSSKKSGTKKCAENRSQQVLLLLLTITLGSFLLLVLDFNDINLIQMATNGALGGKIWRHAAETTETDDSNSTTDRVLTFSPEMARIVPQKFKMSDQEILPQSYLQNSPNPMEIFKTFNLLPSQNSCNQSRVLITIKSAGDHFEHRLAIRESWGNLSQYNLQSSIMLVFLLGKSVNRTLEEEITAEAGDFGDIVQGNYIDTYANLTLKALNGMEYRKRFCNQPEFVLAIDDDTYLDVPSMVAHLDRVESGQDFVECSERTVVKGKVWRTGQWAVDKNLYPADKYPTYCNGPCYLMPSLTASRLHDLVSVTPSDLQADDAFISGVLRSKAAIPLIQYQRNASPGFCRELNNRKPRLPRRMRREFDRR